ncbi:Tic22-like family protein [Thalictrum thalictroides]|uniref:Tic22-like family protein n=1 Tax=Thalictrum thalictroides TaxID=46969 RepID=A0A7J6V5W3_THATH|nr:Tic22-like family protein [Thalictrum thalictroides]
MATSPPESHLNNNNNSSDNNFTRFIQSTSSSFFSLFNSPSPQPLSSPSTSSPFCSSSSICVPLLFADTPPRILSLSTIPTTNSSSTTPSSSQNGPFPLNSQIKAISSGTKFPKSMKISGLNSNPNAGGPAFVGQVFSMCDVSGTGLMAVSTHLQIPFISERTPEWIKRMFSVFNKSENNVPVFRFFMDIGDAVSYVKRLNIPTGVVGACRLDLAYEHFKEKPHMFQFVPNEKQVKAAKKILKKTQHSEKRIVDGVPVFTAQNLDIAIATGDGIKWYTPYFFDKNMLDNILEESVDQHFHSIIQSRHMHRRRDVIDDNLTAEVVEDNRDNLWEPPEVQEVLDEMGYPGVPLSVISKAAEVQILHAVDKVLLGNRWLRRATGIQPKFPYRVDSFEKRTAASFRKATALTSIASNSTDSCVGSKCENLKATEEPRLEESTQSGRRHPSEVRLPFGDWFSHLWSKQQQEPDKQTRLTDSRDKCLEQLPLSPLLPKITMVGISTGEAGQTSKASLKKTMEDLTRELEQPGQNSDDGGSNELRHEDRDPLFVANRAYYKQITVQESL